MYRKVETGTIEAIVQGFPTYLEELLGEECRCLLICRKSTESSKCDSFEDEFNLLSVKTENALQELDLDLTGNPLATSLNEIEFEDAPTILTCELPNWTIEETQHCSLSLTEARKFLRENHSKKSPIPIFCVTNGQDNRNTVIIGSHYSDNGMITYLAHVIPSNLINDDSSLDVLREEHEKSVRVRVQSTQYYFKRIYHIHGCNLKKTSSLEHSKYNGCLYLEVSWNKFTKEPPIIGTRMKLIMKVISSHKDSSIRFLQNQVVDLQKFLDLLDVPEVLEKNTIISNNGKQISFIMEDIHALCNSKLNAKRRMSQENLDLNNLRTETVLDKLWTLLNQCQNLADLKNCFTTFFMIVKPEKLDKNGLAVLSQYIGQTYIEALKFPEILKILIYIGFQKLKEDYFTIINFYYPISRAKLMEKWNEFQPNQKSSKKSSESTANRIIIDTSLHKKKMEFLIKLHETSEILVYLNQVVSKNEFSRSNFSLIYNHVLEKYLFNKIQNQCDDRLNIKLLDVTCDLNADNKEIFENKIHLKTIMEFLSESQTSEVKTVIHISQKKIFPDNIYSYEIDDITLNCDGEIFQKIWYTTKMVILKSKQ